MLQTGMKSMEEEYNTRYTKYSKRMSILPQSTSLFKSSTYKNFLSSDNFQSYPESPRKRVTGELSNLVAEGEELNLYS